MAKTVNVTCSTPSGLVLSIYEKVEGEFGTQTMRRIGSPVTIGPGVTCGVDADFMAAWLEQYKDSDLAAVIRVEDEG